MPPSLLPRDLALIRFTSRYRLALYAPLSRLFFDDKDPGRVLGILAKPNDVPKRSALFRIHSRSLKGGLSYATLTAAGLSAAGLPVKKRALDPLGPAALSNAIAIEVFCVLGQHRRHRLHREELEPTFGQGTPPSNVFHLTSDELGWPAVFRVVFATSVDNRLVDRVKRHVGEARRNSTLRPWLDAGDYGFAVLVPWADKVDAVRELVLGSALGSEVPFIVDLGPTTETLV